MTKDRNEIAMIKPSKKDQLLEFIKNRYSLSGAVTSYEIFKWGNLNFYTCGDRRAREWTQAGVLIRLTNDEKKAKNIKLRFVAWRIARP